MGLSLLGILPSKPFLTIILIKTKDLLMHSLAGRKIVANLDIMVLTYYAGKSKMAKAKYYPKILHSSFQTLA
jgi:hypothetical protein